MNPFRPPSLSLRFVPVWRRNFLVWRKLAIPSLLGNLADPMIYMLGFGYGLGSLLPEVGGVPYIAFIAAGAVCFSTMNAATFEALYSAFSRMQVQRTWDAILNAPMALDDLVLAELVWAASKAALSGAAILAVAGALGLVASPLALWAVAAGLPDRTGLRRARADRDGAGAELRFLHVLLHPVRHADDAALRRVLPGRSSCRPPSRPSRPRCRCRTPCSWRGRCSRRGAGAGLAARRRAGRLCRRRLLAGALASRGRRLLQIAGNWQLATGHKMDGPCSSSPPCPTPRRRAPLPRGWSSCASRLREHPGALPVGLPLGGQAGGSRGSAAADQDHGGALCRAGGGDPRLPPLRTSGDRRLSESTRACPATWPGWRKKPPPNTSTRT
jgi:hypothetical protein